jgi:hypothetical protein
MFKIIDSYDKKFLEYRRINPVFSKKIEKLIIDTINNKFDADIRDSNYQMLDKRFSKNLIEKFKTDFVNKTRSSKLNNLKNLEIYQYIDICLGCTQFIDNLYLSKGVDNLQVLEGEYRYHSRLYPDIKEVSIGNLSDKKDLIISLPFVIGDKHPAMDKILIECFNKNIKVHLDCAWLSAAKNIDFDFAHPAIETIGLSMSKGFGLGWNRIGVRLRRREINDSICIMNNFQMIPTMLICVANHFLSNLEIDHLWNEHEYRYNKICDDFNLIPTSSIHAALDGDRIVGTCELIRYLEYKY